MTLLRNIRPYLVITCLCVGAVFGFYRLVERYWLQPPQLSLRGNLSKGNDHGGDNEKNADNYQIILQRNLFGTGPITSETGKYPNDPLSSLALASPDLLLLGTIAGEKADRRAIILDTGTKKQQLLQIGDSVKGAIVKEISREKVILHFRERDEVLDMNETRRYFAETAALASSRQQDRSKDFYVKEVSPTRHVVPSTRIIPPIHRFSGRMGNRAADK